MWPSFVPRDTGVAAGGWLTTPAESVLDAMCRSGLDYVGIDCQHSLMTVADAARLVARAPGARAALVVRVADQQPAPIGRALDAGADGVIVPGVDTAEQAAAVVAACRYPPAGTRSFGPIRADLGLDPARIEARAACFVMVETQTALEQVEEICAVPGVAGVYVGPGDLAVASGLDPMAGFTSGGLDPAVTRIRQACGAAGIVLGIHSIGGANARHWAALGARMITVGSDVAMLAEACRHRLADLRLSGDGEPAAPSPYS